jgi:hypothetical protein
MATIVIDVRGQQQDARVKAYTDAIAAGKSEAEAQNISATVGNNVGADALSSEFSKLNGNNPPSNNQTDVVEVKTASGSSAQTETNPENQSAPTANTNITGGTGTTSGATGKSSSVEKNILHRYRSWTYNWTLGAISSKALNDESLLASDIKKYTVLTSAGKGTGGIGAGAADTNKGEVSAMTDGFQKNSPGAFDMWIDNVSVKSIAGAGSSQSGPSIATNITFDVFEPYSMSGFIEALMVTAKAAGYTDYVTGVFALRIQFQGYPDNQPVESSKPEIIPGTTRYFIFNITQCNIDVNESGTRYRVEAVPTNQLSFGAANKLTADIKVEGKTVGEVLTNFVKGLNDMARSEYKERTGKELPVVPYQIAAPAKVEPGSPQNVKGALLDNGGGGNYSDIIKSKVNDDLKSPNVFKVVDPARFTGSGYVGSNVTGSVATATNTTIKSSQKVQTVAFASGSEISECIAAIVRDSEYVRNEVLQKQVEEAKAKGATVQYFNIRLEVDVHDYNPTDNNMFKTHRFILEPFQVHFTKVPGQDQGSYNPSLLKSKIKREYNYIYSGKNEDVTKFAINFNNLYFSAMPAQGGNPTSENPNAQAAGPNNGLKVTQKESNAGSNKNYNPNSVATAPITVNPKTANRASNGPTATQPLGDPYAQLALAMHDKITNVEGGSADMITGSLEILGDPYFLCTGGMGNKNLKLAETYLTAPGPDNTGGECPTTQGEVYVSVYFRNPIDIGTDTGMMKFSKLISFSGIYQVIELDNNFKDGMFTQKLEIVRMPGQTVEEETPVAAPAFGTVSYPGLSVTKDTAPSTVLRTGVRPSDFNIANLLGRALPNPGLPGIVSNFTNALTGTAGAVNNVLNQVAGVAGQATSLANQLGVSPVGGVNALTSGIRLTASGLGSLVNTTNLAAANLTVAGNLLGAASTIPNAAVGLANNVAGTISALPTTAIAAANGVVTNVTNNVNSLAQSVTGIVNDVQTNVSNLVGDVTNKLAALQNTIATDLGAVTAKLGIDPSVFSGLDPKVASKLADDLANVAKLVPSGVDLKELVNQGVSFANVTKEKIANLPVFQPRDTAPAAIIDPALKDIAQANGSTTKLLSNLPNLPPLTDINKVTNAMGGISAGAVAAVGNAQSLLNSVASAQKYVNDTVGAAAGVINNVGSLAQNTVQGFSPASLGLGSVESNLANVTALTQNVTKTAGDLSSSVAAQYNSLQQSPLAKLVQDTNINKLS